jgi:two-component system, chemotaxis family, sensor kinase CheA
MRDELSRRLLHTFLAELEDQVRALNAHLLELEETPDERGETLRSLFRIAHTVKGAAAVAGASRVEVACHALEAVFVAIREGRRAPDPALFRLLFRTADALAAEGRRLAAGEADAQSELPALALELNAAAGQPAHRGMGGAPPAPPAPEQAEPGRRQAADGVSATARRGGPDAEQWVRVQSERLDALLSAAGELLGASGRVDALRREGEALRDRLERVATAGREELPRLVEDGRQLAAELAEGARLVGRQTTALADIVRELRLRPVGDACEALPRAVRDVAAEGGKEARLELEGVEVQVDRAVVDALREPLLHLVRNAVDHGIEPPRERAAAGKAPEGTVRVAATLEGGRLIVTVSDDGAGLNVAAVREQLRRAGRDAPDSDRELALALFEGGVTTRGEATTISGRGVGLDLVRARLERIGGTVHVKWRTGAGSRFVLNCPPSPATLRVLLVGVGAHTFALPVAQVVRLVRVRPGEGTQRVEGRTVLTDRDEPVPLVTLASLLGPPITGRRTEGPVPVVLLELNGRRVALAVDELLAEQEVVVRSLAAGPTPLPHVAGGALLPSGRVALVLSAAGVIARALRAGGAAPEPAAEPRPATRRRVLVVDDSITTRTLEQSVLEAAGYEVSTAVDGQDGWRRLQEEGADLVVTDIEMPRMDGIALCEAIRRSARFAGLPVVLVTALEAPETRARGLEAGADAYLPKSSFDQETLLDTIRELLGEPES